MFWHGGTPNTGLPPEPLLADAERLGLRLVGADRPGYGGMTRDPDAPLVAVADDVAAVLDHLGLERCATLGHSGGDPRALATAARLPDRVTRVVAVSSPAPADAEGLDRSAGAPAGIAREQRAAAEGREALEAHLESEEFDPEQFTPSDRAALQGPWSWFMGVVAAATADGPDGQVDDLLAQQRPWGFPLDAVAAPVLVLHGADDRIVPPAHGAWLAARLRQARLEVVPGAGHVSVLEHAAGALAFLRG
ncbi:alpha/beta fold hydrolase [Amnibacterium endophyticum]|uniref:Alpha/beta fold hydrolase n=1 Tax=Amnibacterium endophyticum TaxID=2109337 RepID=A0ABW4LJG9_9MICO